MNKFFDFLMVFLFVALIFSIVNITKEEKIKAAYEQLDAKGGIAVFEEVAVVELESLGGQYSDQDLVDAYRTKKSILKDPVTGDLFVGIRIYVGGVGIFRVNEEGKILQELTTEEFYKLGVVDRLVK